MKYAIVFLLFIALAWSLSVVPDRVMYSPYQTAMLYITECTPYSPTLITIEYGSNQFRSVVEPEGTLVIRQITTPPENFTITVRDLATNSTASANVVVVPYTVKHMETDNEIYLWDSVSVRIKVEDAQKMPAVGVPCVIQTEIGNYVIEGFRANTNNDGMIVMSIPLDDKYSVDATYNVTATCYGSTSKRAIKVVRPTTPLWVFNFLVFLSNNAVYVIFLLLLVTLVVYGYNIIRSAI